LPPVLDQVVDGFFAQTKTVRIDPVIGLGAGVGREGTATGHTSLFSHTRVRRLLVECSTIARVTGKFIGEEFYIFATIQVVNDKAVTTALWLPPVLDQVVDGFFAQTKTVRIDPVIGLGAGVGREGTATGHTSLFSHTRVRRLLVECSTIARVTGKFIGEEFYVFATIQVVKDRAVTTALWLPPVLDDEFEGCFV